MCTLFRRNSNWLDSRVVNGDGVLHKLLEEGERAKLVEYSSCPSGMLPEDVRLIPWLLMREVFWECRVANSSLNCRDRYLTRESSMGTHGIE